MNFTKSSTLPRLAWKLKSCKSKFNLVLLEIENDSLTWNIKTIFHFQYLTVKPKTFKFDMFSAT